MMRLERDSGYREGDEGDEEDPEFICNRCHKPFEPVKNRCIVDSKKDKFLCPRCFKLLLE